MQSKSLKQSANFKPLLGYSLYNPAPVGKTVKAGLNMREAYMTNFSEFYELQITVNMIIRGKEGTDYINKKKLSLGTIEPGFEPIVILMKFAYFHKGIGSGTMDYRLFLSQFAAVPQNTKNIFNPVQVKKHQLQLADSIFKPGESREGFIVLQVPRAEKRPLMIMGRESELSLTFGLFGYIWFKLY